MFDKIFKVGKRNVSINADRTELKFDDGWQCTYAYFDRDNCLFRFDLLIVPKSVVSRALNWAKKPNNMVSIYSD